MSDVTTEAPPSSTEPSTVSDGPSPPASPLTGSRRYSGLKRYPKGSRPPQLKRGRVGPTKKDLERVIQRIVRKGSQEELEELGWAIWRGAKELNPACLSFLLPRLWPLEQGAQGGKVVLSGIRLEVAEGKTSVTVVGSTNPSSGGSLAAPQLDGSEEGPLRAPETEGILDGSNHVQPLSLTESPSAQESSPGD